MRHITNQCDKPRQTKMNRTSMNRIFINIPMQLTISVTNFFKPMRQTATYSEMILITPRRQTDANWAHPEQSIYN